MKSKKKSLDRLPENLAVLCFSYLNATEQAKTKCVNKWARGVIEKFQDIIPCWSNALVEETHPNYFTTVAATACQNAQAKPSFGLMYTNSSQNITRGDMEELKAKFPDNFQCIVAPVAGICGISNGDTPIQFEDNNDCIGASLTIGHLPRSHVEVHTVESIGLLSPEDDWKVFVVLLQRIMNPSNFLHNLQQRYPDVTIVGGIVEQKMPIGILKDGEIVVKRMKGAVLAMRGEGVVFNSQVSMACRPLTEFCTIHDFEIFSRGNGVNLLVVQQVRTPAGEIINSRDLATIAEEAMGHDHIPLYLGLGAESGLSLYNFSILPGGSELEGLIAKIDVSHEVSGLGVRIFGLDGPSSREDIKRRLQAGARACVSQSRDVLGGLLFSCCGRTSDFYNGEDNVEVSLFRRVFPRQHIGGFLAYGEIGPRFSAGSDPDNPVRENANLQGFTAVYGMFFVPKTLPQLQAQSPRTSSAVKSTQV